MGHGDLGFRAQGLGWGLGGLGSRLQGLGFGSQGLGMHANNGDNLGFHIAYRLTYLLSPHDPPRRASRRRVGHLQFCAASAARLLRSPAGTEDDLRVCKHVARFELLQAPTEKGPR